MPAAHAESERTILTDLVFGHSSLLSRVQHGDGSVLARLLYPSCMSQRLTEWDGHAQAPHWWYRQIAPKTDTHSKSFLRFRSTLSHRNSRGTIDAVNDECLVWHTSPWSFAARIMASTRTPGAIAINGRYTGVPGNNRPDDCPDLHSFHLRSALCSYEVATDRLRTTHAALRKQCLSNPPRRSLHAS